MRARVAVMRMQQVRAKCSAEMMCIQRLHANECVAGSDPHLDTNNELLLI